MQEIWKDIEGYEGFYKISNYGNVYSCERTVVYERRGSLCSRKYDGKLMKPEIDKDGYKTVNLKNKKGKKKHEKIHRLVANAFLENPNNYNTVHHIDHNKINNMPSNLEYIDEHKHHELHRGEANKASCKSTSKEVLQYAGDVLIASYVSTGEASRMTGISQPGISMAASGKRKSAGGYRWEYK